MIWGKVIRLRKGYGENRVIGSNARYMEQRGLQLPQYFLAGGHQPLALPGALWAPQPQPPPSSPGARLRLGRVKQWSPTLIPAAIWLGNLCFARLSCRFLCFARLSCALLVSAVARLLPGACRVASMSHDTSHDCTLSMWGASQCPWSLGPD